MLSGLGNQPVKVIIGISSKEIMTERYFQRQ